MNVNLVDKREYYAIFVIMLPRNLRQWSAHRSGVAIEQKICT